MKIAIFTGPREASAEDYVYVQAVAREIISRGFHVYVGDATGVDAIAWDLAQQESNRCQIGLYERFCPRPDLGRTPAGLAERSTRMVKEALRAGASEIICVGFPNKPCPAGIVPARSWRSGGSGTWSTIALARGNKIETWVFPIGGFATPPFWCGTPEKLTEELHGWNYRPAMLFPASAHDALLEAPF